MVSEYIRAAIGPGRNDIIRITRASELFHSRQTARRTGHGDAADTGGALVKKPQNILSWHMLFDHIAFHNSRMARADIRRHAKALLERRQVRLP